MPPSRAIAAEPILPTLLAPIADERARECPDAREPSEIELAVLCRQTDQIEAAVAQGIATIYADYQDIKEYDDAVAAAHRGGSSIYLATPRIEKPGEGNIFKYLAGRGADGLLVRNAGGMHYCSEHGIPFVADFSMNAANPLSVERTPEPRGGASDGVLRPERATSSSICSTRRRLPGWRS